MNTNTEISQKISDIINSNDVVLFMKGTTETPMCGFSATVVNILRLCGIDNFCSIDVLEDEKIRQGIKDFTSWPTIPQLYIKQEFIGGCDITREMYQDGSLKKLLKDKGII